MTNKQPINFINNTFIYDNGEREYFSGEKEYLSLPNKQKVLVSNKNLWDSIKPIFIPISQITANIKGYQYRQIQDNDKIEFYDLECDDSENFILGYVGDKKFTDPKEMVKELMNYNILVGFNIIKFDNNVLKKYAPEYFLEVKNADFSAFTLNGKLLVDILSILKINFSLESYGAEFIAKYNNFPEEILSHEVDKDLKCQQDIRILRFLYEKYNIKKVFNKVCELANIDTTLLQVIKGERIRKWMLINKYLRDGYLPLKTNKARQGKVDLGIVKYFKEGLYENYRYDDISSTYPTTAILLGNLGIYDNNDTFSRFQEELRDLSKDKELKPFTKSIANALCGIQYSLNEYWRNDDVFERIVNFTADKVKNILNSRKDVVYVNTDCWVIPKDSPKIEIDGYDIKTNYEFYFVYIYNNNKWIGKTKDRIEYRGFTNLNSTYPKIYYYAREEILEKLFKAKDSEEFKELLDDTEKLISKTLKNLKSFKLEDFKKTIRKTDEYCRDFNLTGIWNELKLGFNDLYFDKDEKLTLNEKNISYKVYKDMLIKYAKEYATIKI